MKIVDLDRHQIAEDCRKRARQKEAHAAYWTGDLPEWRASPYDRADIQVEQHEQYAHRAMMVARSCWKMAWALEHCVEHEDCLANPELAKACLTDTLTALTAKCGPPGPLTSGQSSPGRGCYGGYIAQTRCSWTVCAPSERAPSRRCPRG